MLDHSDMKLLEVFLAVVDRGSMSAAGEALHRSNASVSESVAKLESKLGFDVLVRTPKGSYPNAAGRELAHSVRELLAQVDRSLSSIAAMAGEAPTLRVGSVYGIYNELANSLSLDGYRSVGVSMPIDNPGPSLVSAEVDLAMLMGPTSQDRHFERRHLFTEPRVAVVREEAVPEDATTIRLDELNEFVWPAVPVGADERYLEPWLCYDGRGGPPPRQKVVSTDPFALVDWLQQTRDGVVPTTGGLAALFVGMVGFAVLPIVGVSDWDVELAARSDTDLPLDQIAEQLAKIQNDASA